MLTHGPAWGILDTVVNRRDVNLGCELLAKRFETLNPLLHLCGHIHTGYGYVEKNGTHFFNASVLDERYRYNQKPFEIKQYATEHNLRMMEAKKILVNETQPVLQYWDDGGSLAVMGGGEWRGVERCREV